ncbi:MAG: response regulator transcription factor [Granulosicoccus sp.]
MQHVLLIDDDGKLGEVLTDYCARFAIMIEQALKPSVGLHKLTSREQAEPFDAVIVDVMLPEMDGFDVVRAIRKQSDIPIVMLTARGDVTDRIVGLELGADDYLPKPFDPRELVARLQTNIKRHQASHTTDKKNVAETQQFEGLTILPAIREVHVDNQPVDLTTMEYALLTLLADEPGRAFSRDEILSVLKGTDNELFSRSVDILVSRLRAKLKPAKPVRTIHGAGYAFIARAKNYRAES